MLDLQVMTIWKVNDSPYGPVNATMLSAVAAKDNTSATVEVHTMIFLSSSS